MISEVITSAEALIMMYIPVFGVYLVQFLELYFNYKRTKLLDVKNQVQPVIDEVAGLSKKVEALITENYNLREENSLLKKMLIKDLSAKDHINYSKDEQALKERLK